MGKEKGKKRNKEKRKWIGIVKGSRKALQSDEMRTAANGCYTAKRG